MQRFIVFLMIFLPACGSKLDTGPANRIQTLKTSDAIGPADNTGGCQISNPPQALVGKGFVKHNINGLRLATADGRSKSLCDYLSDMDSSVAIVQFSGVTCLSCQDEGKFFTSKLNLTQVYGNKILHMVALTDLLTDYEEQDFAGFMTKYAPKSLRAHDAETTLWRYFSVNKNEPVRPTIVTYNRYGWAYVLNTEGRKPQELLDQATILVDATPAQAPNPVPGDDANSDDATPITPQPTAAPTPGTVPAGGPTPAPVPTATPTKPAAVLTAAQNVALIGGSSGETISSFFGDSNYLIIDLSQYYCSYCRDLANEHQRDTRFQTAMKSGKCTSLTVVPSGDVALWQRAYPTSTYIGQTSRGVSNESGLARAFGVNFSGTPTVFMIDRTGKVVDSDVGQFPASVSSRCY